MTVATEPGPNVALSMSNRTEQDQNLGFGSVVQGSNLGSELNFGIMSHDDGSSDKIILLCSATYISNLSGYASLGDRRPNLKE